MEETNPSWQIKNKMQDATNLSWNICLCVKFEVYNTNRLGLTDINVAKSTHISATGRIFRILCILLKCISKAHTCAESEVSNMNLW